MFPSYPRSSRCTVKRPSLPERAVLNRPIGPAPAWVLAASLALAATVPAVAADAPVPAVQAPALHGLVFLSSAAQLSKLDPVIGKDAIDVAHVPALQNPAFIDAVRPLLGKPISMDRLNALTPLVIQAFTAQHHPAVRVTIPEQDVSGGVVQVVVTEFRVGNITVTGNKWVPSALIRRGVGLSPGDEIDDEALAADIRRLGKNQFRTVESIMRPGAEPGLADIDLHTTDRLPVSVSVGYNNDGTPNTGRNQYTAGITVGNVIGTLDDTVNYQILSSDFTNQRPNLLTHSAGYDLMLPPLGELSISGLYSNSRPPGGVIATTGLTEQASLRLTHDLPDYGALQVSLTGGYDYKTTNNNVAFGGTIVSATFADVSQFVVGALASRADEWGQTDLSLTAFLSPGGMTPGNTDTAFATIAAGARSHYAYGRLDLTRATRLPDNLLWYVHLLTQEASGTLLPSEEISAGGLSSVRGYPTNTILGDNGIILNDELRYTGLQVSTVQIQPHVFLDYAVTSAIHPVAGQLAAGTLTSTGVGFRLAADRFVNLAVDLGFQVRTGEGIHRNGQFGSISVTLTY